MRFIDEAVDRLGIRVFLYAITRKPKYVFNFEGIQSISSELQNKVQTRMMCCAYTFHVYVIKNYKVYVAFSHLPKSRWYFAGVNHIAIGRAAGDEFDEFVYECCRLDDALDHCPREYRKDLFGWRHNWRRDENQTLRRCYGES